MWARKFEVVLVLACVALVFWVSQPQNNFLQFRANQGWDASRYYEEGKLLHRQGRLQESYAAFTQSLSLDSKQDCPWNSRAWLCCSLKRYDQALSDSQKALELATKPGCLSAIWHTRATALQALERRNEARRAVDMCLSYDPQSSAGRALKADLAR